MLYFLLLFYIATVSAWWRDDDTTGYLWDPTVTPVSAWCGASPSSDRDACCATKQEAFIGDRSDIVNKQQIALPDDAYVGTFLQQEIKTALCPVWKGIFYAYTSGPSYFGQIGTATMRWGGNKGTCLIFKFDVSKTWSTYHIRVGSTSMGATYSSFPPFTPLPSEWYTGSFTSAGSEISICPVNPGATATGGLPTGTYTPTDGPGSDAQFPLPGCYQTSFVSVRLSGFSTDGIIEAYLVPDQQTTLIPSSIPGTCPDGISAYNIENKNCGSSSIPCSRCIAGTDCCADINSRLYGICQSSAATNCPTKPACSGGNCPDNVVNGYQGITCIPVDEKCNDGGLGQFCWGKLACHPINGCPPGYFPDMFCYANGNSGGMKVCCSIGVSYVDFTATSTPSCTDYCWGNRYKLLPYGAASTAPDAGTLRAAVNGGELLLSYRINEVNYAGYSISRTRVWVGTGLTSSSAVPAYTWSYVTAENFIETAYDAVPTLEDGDRSISVNYDLLRAIGHPLGTRIACGTSFQFMVEVQLSKVGSPTVVVSLPATGVDRSGLPVSLISLGSGVYVAPSLRCCYDGNTDVGDQCSPNAPCSPTNKFMDNFKWDKPGIEFQTDRCCAVDRVLDNVLQALPEGVNNVASSGLALGKQTAKCISASGCTMSWSYLYESTNTRSVAGYFFVNPATGSIDTTKLNNGYGYVYPDVSSRHSAAAPGCLVGGDTMTVSIPSGATIGWYIAPSSWTSKAGTVPTGVRSSLDSTFRFGTYSFGGVGGVILAVEDGSDNDFNDVLFGLKLNPTSGWEMTGLATDRCTGVVSSCSTFRPYSYALYVFKPECRPFITLDIAVGNPDPASKDTTNFYAIPDGWEIAPMDALAIKAVTSYGESWATTCFVGVSSPPTTPVTYVGLNSLGQPCNGFQQTWVKTQSNPDGSASSCYTVGTNGHILLRQKQIDPFCSVNNYGEYCSATAPGGTFYTQPASNEPSSVWINLVSGSSTQVPFYIPIINELQVYVLIDTFNTVSSPNNEVLSMQRTLPYMLDAMYSSGSAAITNNIGSGWQAQWVNYGTTTSTGDYNTNCIWATRVTQMTPKTDTSGCTDLAINGHQNRNILVALTKLLKADQAMTDWRPTMPRYIYVPTKDTFASFDAAQVAAFKQAMIDSGIYVTFGPSVGTAVSALQNMITTNAIPRVAVSSQIAYPSFSSTTKFPSNTIATAASNWLTPVATARKTLDGRMTFKKLATPEDNPVFFTLNAGPFSVANLGITKFPDFQYYTIPDVITAALPAGYPGTNTDDEIPRIANWEVTEILSATYQPYSFSTYAFWNEPPQLLVDPSVGPLVYSFSDATPAPYLVKLLEAIISASDPNFNRLDVIFSESTFAPSYVPSGGSVWPATAVGYLGTSSGADLYSATTGVILNQRFNIVGFYVTPKPGAYGTWTLKYSLYDGCLSVDGTLIINFFRTQVPPTCDNFATTVTVGSGIHTVVDFSTATSATNLKTCDPTRTLTSACGAGAPAGCTSCYTGTVCCAAGTGVGTCGAVTAPATHCPGGSAYLCSGYSCPTQLTTPPSSTNPGLITCVPSGTCTSGTCVGSTRCNAPGCPEGLQDGLFCVYQASAPSMISVCCSQLASNALQIAILDDRTSTFGPVNRQTAGVWNPIKYLESRADNTPLQFQLTAIAVPDPNPTVWRYTARSSLTNRQVECTVTIDVLPPNYPPTITPTQTITTAATSPRTIGSWTVTICDPNKGDLLTVYFDEPSVNWATLHGDLTLFKGLTTGQTVTYAGSTTTYTSLQSAPSAQDVAILTSQTLDATTGCTTLDMQWSPQLTHSQTVPDTFKLYVADNGGASSQPITITLRVPGNSPPVFQGDNPTLPTGYDRNSKTPLPITIWGNDPDQAHTEVLTLTITQLPDPQLGVLYFNGVPVTINTPYTVNDQTQITNDGKTSYGFTFVPAGNLFGTVTIPGFFTDPAGATGSGSITFDLPKGPVPPTTQSVAVTTTRTVSVDLTIPFFSEDSQANGLIIESISLRFPDAPDSAQFTYMGTPIFVGQVITIPTPTASGTLTFQYVTDQYQAINDFFTYRAIDARSPPPLTTLRSAPSTATVTGPGTPIPNDPPTTEPGMYTTPFNTPIPITFTNSETPVPTSYYDPDDTTPISSVLLTITTLPTNGKLTSGGIELTVGSVVEANTVVYIPNPTYEGPDSFEFTATDRDGASSSDLVSITVQPKPLPPTLVIDPESVTVYRTQTGSFTVTVDDPDSNTLKVYITGIQIPFGPTTDSWTDSFEIFKCDDAACTTTTKIETYTVTKVPLTNELVITADVPTPTALKETGLKVFKVNWTPSRFIPDDTTGEFSMYVVDPTGRSSATDTGKLFVEPNRQPVIEDNPSGPSYYSFPDKTTDSTSFPVTLFSTDPDSWDTDKLTYIITDVPSDSFFLSTDDCVTAINAVPAPIDQTSNVAGTSSTGTITVCPSNPSAGTKTFTFVTVDPLGKVSDPQTVTITFTDLADPPISSNLKLYVMQDSKVFGISPLSDNFASIIGVDPDVGQTDTLELVFESLPTSAEGKLGFFPIPETGDMTELVLGAGGLSDPAARPTADWKYWFEPAPGVHSEGCPDLVQANCQVFTTATFYVVDSTGLRSVETYTLEIYVIPINTPPTSQNLVFRIPMNSELVVSYSDLAGTYNKLPVADADNTDAEISARAIGFHPNNVGTWYNKNSVVVPTTASSQSPVAIPDRFLRYVPPANTYSSPSDKALGTLYFEVFDLQPLYSTFYSVQVFVDYVPPVCVWKGPNLLVAREDTDYKINLISADNYENTLGAEVLFTLLSGPKGTDKGYFFTCPGGVCAPIDMSSGSFVMPPDGFYYRPPQDANGVAFTSFDFKLELLDPTGKPHAESTCLETVTIDVTPVNDPPTLIPEIPSDPSSKDRQLPITPTSWEGECDENTDTFPDIVPYFRFRFSATDIDNALGELRAQTINVIDSEKAALYECAQRHQNSAEHHMCEDGRQITSIEFIDPIAPGVWEVSFVANAETHWNSNFGGKLELKIVIWDNDVFTPQRSFKLRVWPINDYPTVVKGATSVLVEVYEHDTLTNSYVRLNKDGGEGGFEIHTPERFSALREDLVPGEVLESNPGRVPVEIPDEEKPERPETTKEVNVYRLRTEVQDNWDFTFGIPLNFTGTLVRASWTYELEESSKRAPGPCTFVGPKDGTRRDFTVNCFVPAPGGIVALNAHLKNKGIPFRLEADSEGNDVRSAIGVFMIEDMGNVDKKNRPLAGGFTIIFSRPGDDEALAVPLAAVVILPIIAAATAAVIAAAWILLGQRAQEYAGASFDAFAVVSSNAGTKSPLYDDLGREVRSPLYNGQGQGA